MVLRAILPLRTKTAVTSLIMVQFDCFHLSVVANNWGHDLHHQMLAHMCPRAHEFRANLRAKALKSVLLGADGK